MRRAGLALAAALLTVAALGVHAAGIDVDDRGLGVAVPIGGGLKADHEVVWQRLIELSGGAGSRWVVLGTASEDPTGSAAAAVKMLRQRGAQAEPLPVSPLLKDRPIADTVRDPALIEKVRAARGIFFTGGSQDRIVDHLYPGGQVTPLLQAIWDVYRAGGVVAGTSAGAAIMSSTMFRDAPDILAVMKGRLRPGHEVDRGLGFVGSTLFVDQHFFKRGRIGRLLPMMVASGYTLGLGVEENSAVAVCGNEVEVIGGKAMLVDLAEARHDAAAGVFNLRGARVALLDRGDKLLLRERLVRPARVKLEGQRLDPSQPGYKPYYTSAPFYVDMLADNAIATAMGLLIDATYDEIRGIAFDPRAAPDDPQPHLGFAFRLAKGPRSIGWYSEASGGEDYTVDHLLLDVEPIRMARPLYEPWSAPQKAAAAR